MVSYEQHHLAAVSPSQALVKHSCTLFMSTEQHLRSTLPLALQAIQVLVWLRTIQNCSWLHHSMSHCSRILGGVGVLCRPGGPPYGVIRVAASGYKPLSETLVLSLVSCEVSRTLVTSFVWP